MKECLVIDGGNSRLKIARFTEGRLQKTKTFETFADAVVFIEKLDIDNLLFGNADALTSAPLFDYFKKSKHIRELTRETQLNFINQYNSKSTLGLDRVAAVAGAVSLFSKRNILIIDAGTCITYDLVNDKAEYLGGAISPGLSLRFRSMNDYTSKLPLIETYNEAQRLIGRTTNECMLSGVLNGCMMELEGMVKRYKQEMSDLTVILSGGDILKLKKASGENEYYLPSIVVEGIFKLLS